MHAISKRLYIILDAAWRRRYTIVIPILLMPFIGYWVGGNMPKVYNTHTSMLIQETSKMNPFLEEYAVSAMIKERMNALDTLLHSRHILTQVARERGMITDQTPAWQQQQIIGELSGQLRMTFLGKDVVQISIEQMSNEGIKETLETVSHYFVEELLAPERSSIRDSETFLNSQVNERRIELEAAELKLAEFKTTNAEDMPELQAGNGDRLASMKKERLDKQTQLNAINKNLANLDRLLSNTNPVVASLEQEIISLESELALLRSRYTEKHSKVQGTIRKLRRLNEERSTLLTQKREKLNIEQLLNMAGAANAEEGNKQTLLVSQLESLYEMQAQQFKLEEEIKNLDQQISDISARTKKLGQLEKEMKSLTRDLDVKRKMYEELLESAEKARVTGSLGMFESEKRIKVIDEPYKPLISSTPSASVFAILGVFGGLFIGIGLAFVREFLDSSIRYCHTLTELTGVPVLTRLPQITKPAQPMLIEQDV